MPFSAVKDNERNRLFDNLNGWQLAAPKIYNPTPGSVAEGVGYIALLCDEANRITFIILKYLLLNK